MPPPNEQQYPPNKPLGPSPKTGFGLNAAQAAPELNEVFPSSDAVITPPTGPVGPQPTPSGAPTPAPVPGSPAAPPTLAGFGQPNFNINELVGPKPLYNPKQGTYPQY